MVKTKDFWYFKNQILKNQWSGCKDIGITKLDSLVSVPFITFNQSEKYFTAFNVEQMRILKKWIERDERGGGNLYNNWIRFFFVWLILFQVLRRSKKVGNYSGTVPENYGKLFNPNPMGGGVLHYQLFLVAINSWISRLYPLWFYIYSPF